MKKLFIALCLVLTVLLPTQGFATVSSTDNKIIYVGDDTVTVFPYNFKIFADTDLVVTKVVIASGVATEQTLTTHYTVSGAGVASGGNVTMLAAPADTEELVIQRILPLTQGTDLVDNQAFSLEVLEEGYDRVIMIAQQHKEELDRVLIQSITEETAIEFPSPVADNVIGWDSAGITLENKSGLAESVAEAEAALAAAEDALAAAVAAQAAAEAALASAQLAQAAAEAAQVAAEIAAASVNLPTIQVGDENKILEVNVAEDGYELTATPTFTGLTTGGITASGNLDIGAFELRARTLESDVATGAAPLTIASTTKVTNLNADLLDGLHASATPVASHLLALDASGHFDTSALVLTRGKEKEESVAELLNVGGAHPTFADIATTFTFFCPSDANNIYMSVEMAAVNVGHTAYFRLKVEASTTSAPTVTVKGTTYERKLATIPVQAGWLGAEVTITPQMMCNYGANLCKIFNGNNVYIWVD